jgi:hypothetical protein
LTQGGEKGWIQVGYSRDLVIECRRAAGDGTGRLAKGTAGFAAGEGAVWRCGCAGLVARHGTSGRFAKRTAVGRALGLAGGGGRHRQGRQ